MSELTFNLESSYSKSVESTVQRVATFSGAVVIEKIIDSPGDKSVEVVLTGVGDLDGFTIALLDLSYDNYASDWTYSQIQMSVQSYLTSG